MHSNNNDFFVWLPVCLSFLRNSFAHAETLLTQQHLENSEISHVTLQTIISALADAYKKINTNSHK